MRYFKHKEIRYNKIKEQKKKTFTIKLVDAITLFFVSDDGYDKKLDTVYEWLVEYNEDMNYVQREIGLDIHSKPVIKMAFKYQYGVHSELITENFDKLIAFEITNKTYFTKKWQEQ